jgi:hypothetical protein
MAETKRSTIYFEPGVYRALKIKAAVTDESISDLVNDAVRQSLGASRRRNAPARARHLSREDAADIAAFRDRAREPRIPYERVLRDLKRKGLL